MNQKTHEGQRSAGAAEHRCWYGGDPSLTEMVMTGNGCLFNSIHLYATNIQNELCT